MAMSHSTVVEISQKAFALGAAATIYNQCLLEEQRLLREHDRLMERIKKNQSDKKFYGRLIGEVK